MLKNAILFHHAICLGSAVSSVLDYTARATFEISPSEAPTKEAPTKSLHCIFQLRNLESHTGLCYEDFVMIFSLLFTVNFFINYCFIFY